MRRVVITGMGAVSPIGLSAKETWGNALEGKSGIGQISLFDTKDRPVTIAGEVKGYDFSRPMGPFKPAPGQEVTMAGTSKDARRVGRFVHLAMGAGLEAYGDSGLDNYRDKISADRIG